MNNKVLDKSQRFADNRIILVMFAYAVIFKEFLNKLYKLCEKLVDLEFRQRIVLSYIPSGQSRSANSLIKCLLGYLSQLLDKLVSFFFKLMPYLIHYQKV